MSRWFRIASITALLFHFALPAQAKEWRPSQPEIMYLQAVAAGDIQKARDLAELGNINPANIAGHPLAAHLMNAWWGIARPALWRDSVFNYVFVELKQDPNAVPQDQERTVFSSFCQNMLDGNSPQESEATFKRTIERIHVALRLGAKVTEYPAQHHWDREWQPLPACLDTYEALPENSPLKTEFLQLIDLYLAKGADPNYRYDYGNLTRTVPLTVAIRHFDVPLLAVLIKNRANPKLTFKVDMRQVCGRGPARTSTTDTLITGLPEPSDKDAARADAFLRAFAAAGGDITTPIFSCRHGSKSLKEMAVDDAQIEYARMAMRLEKEPPTAADAPKLPDDFHYGGHTPHGGEEPAQEPPQAGASPTSAPSPEQRPQLANPGREHHKTSVPERMASLLFGSNAMEPRVFNLVFYAPDGTPTESKTVTYTMNYKGGCRLEVPVEYKEAFLLENKRSTAHSSAIIDFSKVTDVRVVLEPDALATKYPEHNTPNPSFKPVVRPVLKIFGDNAACFYGEHGAPQGCIHKKNQYATILLGHRYTDILKQQLLGFLKRDCSASSSDSGNPTPQAKATAAPSPQDGLLALYGFRSTAPITRHFDMFDPQGNVAKQVDVAYVPKIIDGCHVEVTRTQRETYPTHILQDRSTQFTNRYDLSRFASIRVANEPDDEIITYQADAALGGMTFRQPPLNVLTTYVDGSGAKCTVGIGGKKNCNSAEVRVAPIAVPNVTQKDIYLAFNRATRPCQGALAERGREAAMRGGR